MKATVEEFMAVDSNPAFDKAKAFMKGRDVRYVRYWVTENTSTVEVHLNSPRVKHVTIGTGKKYSHRIRIAVSLKDMSLFRQLYGELTRKNSSTYVKYDDAGLEMLNHI